MNKVTDTELTLAGAGGTIAVGTQIYTLQKSATDTDTVEVVKGADGKWYEAKASGTEQKPHTGTTPVAATEETTVTNYADALDQALTDIAEATDWLRSYANELGNNYAIIQTRQDFTEAMIDVLETGSDNLVLADMNEESANYLALQTRQQLAINSLSLASQSAQSVLSLF